GIGEDCGSGIVGVVEGGVVELVEDGGRIIELSEGGDDKCEEGGSVKVAKEWLW
ncbi:hypothetical protein A2U01_0075462, partial [Trifolium medium]|nr:hypothetical protein [Trifolium medium]